MSSFGVAFKEFYCCGKLKTISVILADAGKDQADKSTGKDECCKTKFQFFKVKDKHIAAEKATAPLNLYTTLPPTIPVIPSAPFVAQHIDFINGSHAPPLHTGVPIYISNRVFRI